MAEWPPFRGKAAHLVNHMFPLLCLFVVSAISHLGFKDIGFDCVSSWVLSSINLLT